MKKLVLLLLSLAPLHAQYHDKWPYEACGSCVVTDDPYVIRHRETSRRRYARIPRRPYLRCNNQPPKWYSRRHIDGLCDC